MNRSRFTRGLVGITAAMALFTAACGTGGDESASPQRPAANTSESPPPSDPAKICDKDALVAAVQGGPAEGTLAGMTDDPVGTAASSNPVLTTLVTAVQAAGLVDTLNSADALTVFAPTDCAFAALDPATLKAALADPQGLLTQVLGFHVVAGQRLSAADLAGKNELMTFTNEKLPLGKDGESLTVGGGQAKVVVPDIQTANATVHLIDSVMMPPTA
jgi:transforming growth factor-beta-induced protein